MGTFGYPGTWGDTDFAEDANVTVALGRQVEFGTVFGTNPRAKLWRFTLPPLRVGSCSARSSGTSGSGSGAGSSDCLLGDLDILHTHRFQFGGIRERPPGVAEQRRVDSTALGGRVLPCCRADDRGRILG